MSTQQATKFDVSFCAIRYSHSQIPCLQPTQYLAGAVNEFINWKCALSLHDKHRRSYTAESTSVCTSACLKPKTADDEWILMKVDTTVMSVETTTKLALFKLLQLEITTEGSTNFCGGNISNTSEIS